MRIVPRILGLAASSLFAVGLASMVAAPVAFAQVPSSSPPYNSAAIAALTMVAATASANGATQTNLDKNRLVCDIHITAAASSPSATFSIQFEDDKSAVWNTIVTSAAITATGDTVMQIGPSAPVTANVSANFPLPRFWRVISTIGAGTFTGSVDCAPTK